MACLHNVCARLRASAQPELPVQLFTMKFQCERTESGYLASRKALLLHRSSAIAGVGALNAFATLCFAIGVSRMHMPDSAYSEAHHQANIVTLLAGAFILLLCLATFTILRCKRLTDIASPMAIEVADIFVLIAVMVAAVLSAPANICALNGLDVRDALDYYSDTSVVLVIDGIVTALHLALPVRWIIMLPVQVLSVLLYLSVIFIGGSEPNPFSNFLYLCALVACSSIGKRYAELSERKSFLTLIEEKNMRCTAEFMLSQADNGGVRHHDRGSHDAGSSVTATDRSGSVFDMTGGSQNVVEKLSRIRTIAKAERWSLEGSEVKMLGDQVLGRGGFGIVVKGLMSGIMVAVKVPNKQLEDASSEKLEDICQELRVFRHLRHPNIVSFHGAIIDPTGQKIALVLERVRGTLLHDFVRHGKRENQRKCKPPTTLERFQVLLGISSALMHMHTRVPKIVHSDLKSTNAMVECYGGQAHPKLLDFGLARVMAHGAELRGGTWAWMAPEMMRGEKQAIKCSMDVYSFGHLINFIITGLLPPRPSKRQRRSGYPPLPLPRPPDFPLEPACGPLADACLRFDEDARPSIVEVHHHLVCVPERVLLLGAPARFLADLRVIAQEVRAAEVEGAADRLSGGFDNQSDEAAGPSDVAIEDMNEERDGELSSGEVPWNPPECPPPTQPVGGGRASQQLARHAPRLPPLPEFSSTAVQEALSSKPTLRSPSSQPWRVCSLVPATDETMMLSGLLEVASHWNLERPRPACCGLHAATEAIVHLLVRLYDGACEVLPVGNRFCTSCNLICDGQMCEYCYGPTVDSETLQRPTATPAEGDLPSGKKEPLRLEAPQCEKQTL